MPPRTPAFRPTGHPTRIARLTLPAVVCALVALPGVGRAQIVSNGSFESPAIPTNTYCYPAAHQCDVSGQAWTFAGASGILNGNAGGAGGGFGSPAEPDGVQAAFLQSAGSYGRISQSIVLPTSGTYRLTFYDAGRYNGGVFDGNTIFDALLGTTTIGTFTTTTGSTSYALQTATFTAAAGTYAFAFTFDPAQPGLGTADHDFFLDDVRITPMATTAPEPGTWALLGAGLAMLGVTARARRRA